MAETAAACKEWHKQLNALLEARARVALETQKRLEADTARRMQQLRKEADAARLEAENKLKAAQAERDKERQRKLQESAKLQQEKKLAEQVCLSSVRLLTPLSFTCCFYYLLVPEIGGRKSAQAK